MIVFLYGPDSYRRLSKERAVIDAYHKKHSNLSVARFDLGLKDEVFKFKDFLLNSSMFEVDKLAIVSDPFNKSSISEFGAIVKPYLKDDTKTTILISSDSKPIAKLAFLIKEPSHFEEFALLTGKKLSDFINKEAGKRGLKLKADILNSLINVYGGDAWFVTTELDKLALMSEQKIDTKPTLNYFELINSFKYGRDVRNKIIALEFILSDRRDDSGRVFNSLAFKPRDFKEAVMLADYDVAVKSGKLDYEEVLLDMALR